MYLARSQPEALALALLSMCCWGSWSNTLVYCGDSLRFELYYLDFSFGVLLTALLFALSLGMLGIEGCSPSQWIPNDWEVSTKKMALAAAAGAIFNVANLLLVKGIQMCGLAVAFPLGIGTALVLGTVLTHVMEASSGGDTTRLYLGVGVAFAAVCTTSLVHRLKDAAAAKDADEDGTQAEGRPEDSPMVDEGAGSPSGSSRSTSTAAQGSEKASGGMMICIIGGVLMSLWSPLNARAQDGFGQEAGEARGGPGLSPYGAFFVFSLGIVLSSKLLVPLSLSFPLDKGEPVPLSVAAGDYTSAPCKAHAFGLIGGLVWAAGTLSNAISGQALSFAASYAIGQSAPMIAMCWGIFHFNEFDGAPCNVKNLLGLVFMLYILSIGLIATSH